MEFYLKLLQSSFWAKHKSAFGWDSHFFPYKNNLILVLTRSIALSYSFAYIPFGFTLKMLSQQELKEFVKNLLEHYPKLLFVRLDLLDYKCFSIDEGIDISYPFKIPSFLKKTSSVQPPDTVILPLTDVSLDQILSTMHKKCRYNIRLAQKKGVVVKNYESKRALNELEKWYNLYEITAKRDSIAIHSYDYYRSLFELSLDPSFGVTLSLFLAYHEEDLLAGLIVLIYENQAIYLYGASSNTKRDYMPSYLLQWHAISYAKQKGALWYDFFGIPPTNDTKHPMHGLYRFKTGFGGTLLHRCGAYDYPIKKGLYWLFRFIEKFRLFYFKVIKKR